MLSRQGRPGPRRPRGRPLPPRAVSRAAGADRRLQEPAARGDAPRLRRRLTPGAVADEYLGYAERLRPFVRDTTAWLHQALERGPPAALRRGPGLAAGRRPRQLSLCDQLEQQRGGDRGRARACRPGTSTAGSASSRPTRPASAAGRFPTEQDNAIGERIRRVGKEYGTVTGRPRRCGWFDAVAVRHAARVSGSTELAVMLLDVLSGIDELNVAVAYERDGQTDRPSCPARSADFERCRPDLRDAPRLDAKTSPRSRNGPTCPAQARNYVEFLGKQVGVPVTIVSVGPDRRQTILCPDVIEQVGGIRSGTFELTEDPSRPDMAITEEGLARIAAAGLKPEQLPRHVAIIMDGNGRWAQRRGPAADRRPPPGDPERPRGRRGRVPAGPRSVDALLPLGRELEAAAARADVPDAAAPPLPGRRARRADGAERPAHDDRPPRGPAAGRAATSSSGRPSRPPRTTG